MPIRDAFRTSVLSRNWRYHCANIPKLEFDDELWQGSDEYKLLLDIYSVLLLHRCPVLEFSLCISELESCCEIDQIILHLSRNTALDKFTLCMGLGNNHKLPSSFFSFQNLTHLELQKCVIHPLASFYGFGRLTSLCFYDVIITKSTLLRFLSCCPKIKNFTLIEDELCFTESVCSDFVDLFQYLPLIEHLQMNLCPVKLFALGVIPQKFSSAIVHLNFLAPNIKKLKLKMCRYNPREVVSQIVDYSFIRLDRLILRELEIKNFTGMKPQMDFLKVILAKSPMLGRIRLTFDRKIDYQTGFRTVEKLRELQLASSQATWKMFIY
ncbi:hypothetical protein L1987_62833 [Smallanthus sonchifolius]|uniref:Uncharacterized protein n=1 Tax=Smallanthus sonchifolius TaxID=185202 RepID=A0ACB9CBI1_9ASTR|nr:hypothetical protein L1987_62833 [Smallanthus sonchifolius]